MANKNHSGTMLHNWSNFQARVIEKLDAAPPLQGFATNPVHRDAEHGGWYFYDETWAYRHGPYQTQAGAAAALKRYCKLYL
jgi:hypothetical protein